MDNSFEKDIKEMLTWTYRQWKEAGDKAIESKRLVNSLRFWYGRLRSALKQDNVILTLYSNTQRAYPKLQQLVQSLKELDNDITIEGYAKFKNKRYISVTFKDVTTRNFVAENLKCLGDTQIAYLHWIEESVKTKVDIDWLSNHTDIDLVCDYVSQFLDIHSAHKVVTVLDDGFECLSGRVQLTGELRENIQIDNIPHIDFIDSLECRINIQGRPCMCYNCYKIGHKASQCSKAFCKNCKRMLSKIHVCLNIETEKQNTSGNSTINVLDSFIQDEAAVKDSNIGLNETYTENILSRNLFWNKNQNLLQHVHSVESNNTDKQWPMDYICQDEEDAVTILRNNQSEGNFIKAFTTEKQKTLSNQFITEEACSMDSNFILIDTSSGETDSDTGGQEFSIQDRRTWGLNEEIDSPDISRSFLRDSINLVETTKSTEAKGNKLLIDKKIRDLEKQLKENGQLKEGQEKYENTGTKPKIFKQNSIKKGKNEKKKGKKKK